MEVAVLPIASHVLSMADVTSRTQTLGSCRAARFWGRVLFTLKSFLPGRVL